jgi:hypothetical protein
MLVGLDVSLTSPALAIRNNEGHWDLVCFAQRQRDFHVEFDHNNVHLTVLPPIPSSTQADDLLRYKHVCQHFIDFMVKKGVDGTTKIFLENYAYADPRISGNSYKLHEVTGILKYAMRETLFVTHINTIAISSWKKKIIGKGNAKKRPPCT